MPEQAHLDPTDPNYILNLLQGLDSHNPNSKANLADYLNLTGLDIKGQNQGYNAARFLLPLVYKMLSSQMAYSAGLQPAFQNATTAALENLQNPDKMAAEYRDKAEAQGKSTLQNILQRLRSGGAGIGATQGAQIATEGQAASAGNNFQAQQDSAEGVNARLGAIANLVRSAQADPTMLQVLHGITSSTPHPGSFLQQLGNVAAGYFSGGGGNPFGGASSGGGGGFSGATASGEGSGGFSNFKGFGGSWG